MEIAREFIAGWFAGKSSFDSAVNLGDKNDGRRQLLVTFIIRSIRCTLHARPKGLESLSFAQQNDNDNEPASFVRGITHWKSEGVGGGAGWS